MKIHSVARVGVGAIGIMAITGCGSSDYATKGALDSLRAQLAASHDTMVALWVATDSMNRMLVKKDTTPPPKCPPLCLELFVPPAPQRMAP